DLDRGGCDRPRGPDRRQGESDETGRQRGGLDFPEVWGVHAPVAEERGLPVEGERESICPADGRVVQDPCSSADLSPGACPSLQGGVKSSRRASSLKVGHSV